MSSESVLYLNPVIELHRESGVIVTQDKRMVSVEPKPMLVTGAEVVGMYIVGVVVVVVVEDGVAVIVVIVVYCCCCR